MFESYIGKRVYKYRGNREPKPFKNGMKYNTVKAVINHPVLNMPAFELEEGSYCLANKCRIRNES